MFVCSVELREAFVAVDTGVGSVPGREVAFDVVDFHAPLETSSVFAEGARVVGHLQQVRTWISNHIFTSSTMIILFAQWY